jgi:hypothetical protein
MKALEIHKQGNGYPLAQAREQFARYGIFVLKEFIRRETRDELRSILERELARARERGAVRRMPTYPKADFLLGDVLSIRDLARYQYIFFRRELLEVLQHVLETPELVYFGDSSVQYGEAARGFHKDNVDRYDGTKSDWQSAYGLVRCGFYCQDHDRYSGGLKIRLASHDIPIHTRGRIVDIRTSYGDLVVWNMRLTHSGNNKRLRLLHGLGLHPRLERVLPEALARPEQLPRISSFCAFGRPGAHLDRYIENMNERSVDYKGYFQRARRAEEAASILSGTGVTLRRPNDYYGELDQAS